MRDREIEIIQFSIECGLGQTSDACFAALEEATIELKNTSWWRPIKRFRLLTEWGAYLRLHHAFVEVRRVQEEASAEAYGQPPLRPGA